MSVVVVELPAEAAVRPSARGGTLTSYPPAHSVIEATVDVERALVEFLRTEVDALWPEGQAIDDARAATALRTAIIAWCQTQRRQRRFPCDTFDGLALAVRDFSDEQLVTFCGM